MGNERRKRLEQTRIIRSNTPDLRSLSDSLIEDEPQIVTIADPNALIPQEGGGYIYKRFTMTPVGMEIPQDITPEEWKEVGQVIRGLETSIQWIVGDWAAYGERAWGEDYRTVATELGYEVETLYVYASISRSVQTLIRNQGLSFTHHRLIAPLTDFPELQALWLSYAKVCNLKLADMKKQMAALKAKALSVEEQTQWVAWATEHHTLLTDRPEFAPPTLADDFTVLFARKTVPKLASKRFQMLYLKAGQGDKKAKARLGKEIERVEQWLSAIKRVL